MSLFQYCEHCYEKPGSADSNNGYTVATWPSLGTLVPRDKIGFAPKEKKKEEGEKKT